MVCHVEERTQDKGEWEWVAEEGRYLDPTRTM
jgi:hypothetical protein